MNSPLTQTCSHTPQSRWDFSVEFRTVLTELYRTSVSPSLLPLERVISNIVLEVRDGLPGNAGPEGMLQGGAGDVRAMTGSH